MVSLYDFCQVFYHIFVVYILHLSHLVFMCICVYCVCVFCIQCQLFLVLKYTFELILSKYDFDVDNCSLFMAIQGMCNAFIEDHFSLFDHVKFFL